MMNKRRLAAITLAVSTALLPAYAADTTADWQVNQPQGQFETVDIKG